MDAVRRFVAVADALDGAVEECEDTDDAVEAWGKYYAWNKEVFEAGESNTQLCVVKAGGAVTAIFLPTRPVFIAKEDVESLKETDEDKLVLDKFIERSNRKLMADKGRTPHAETAVFKKEHMSYRSIRRPDIYVQLYRFLDRSQWEYRLL
ncbi:hypothetical protein BDW22DRAFT_240366 [Trametopsis cervina]|nr:hypothetical protein BDW22DRAFT_240366 [Trametopsis cervina]